MPPKEQKIVLHKLTIQLYNHKLSEFNFVQAFIFLISYFVNISSPLDWGTSKGESGKNILELQHKIQR